MTTETITLTLELNAQSMLRGAEMLAAAAAINNELLPPQPVVDLISGAVQSHVETVDTPPPAPDIAVPAPELDSAGYPWDERIHGKSRKKTAKDQRWTKIKNLDKNQPGLFEKVMSELTGEGYGPTASDAPDTIPPATADTTPPSPPPPATQTPVADIDPMYVNASGEQFTLSSLRNAGWTNEQIAEQLMLYVAPVLSTATPTEITFPELMALVNPALASGVLTDESVSAAVATVGLSSLVLLSAQPQLVGAVKTALFG